MLPRESNHRWQKVQEEKEEKEEKTYQSFHGTRPCNDRFLRMPEHTNWLQRPG